MATVSLQTTATAPATWASSMRGDGRQAPSAAVLAVCIAVVKAVQD